MINKKLLVPYFLFFYSACFSQWDADPGFGGGQKDPATEPLQTPIDGIEIPLLITGVVLAIFVIRKKQKVTT